MSASWRQLRRIVLRSRSRLHGAQADRLGRLVAALSLTVLLWCGGSAIEAAEASGSGRVFTSVKDLNALRGKDREVPQSVRLEFRATFVDVNWRNLWLEENDGTSYLMLSETPPPITAGQKVLLQGSVIPAQGLSADRIAMTVLEEENPVPPEDITGRVGEIYALDQHRVRVRAFVDAVQYVRPRHARLSLIAENRELIGWILLKPDELMPALAGQFVELESLYSSRTDTSGTRPEIELWTQSTAQVKVLHSLTDDPSFLVPVTPLSQLLKLPVHTKVRVRGRVQDQQPGRSLVVRDATGQVTVETIQQQCFSPGTEVEAAGDFVVMGSACTIRSALVRRLPALVLPAQAAAQDTGVITMAEDIRKLSGEEAGRGRRVNISGVVTWFQADLPYFFVQDISGGVRVNYRPGTAVLPIIGKNVKIEGRTRESGPFPSIEMERWSDLGAMSLPQPRRVTYEQAMTGSEDGQWVELQGFLRSCEVLKDNRTHLEITTPSGVFEAMIWTAEDLESMKNALIRLSGVCDNSYDDERRVTGIRLWVPFVHDIAMDEPPPADAYDCALKSIRSLRQMSAIPGIVRARIQGRVLAQRRGRYLYVQQEDAGMLVLSGMQDPLVPGDLVEAVGLVGREGARTLLRDAVYRRIGHAEPPSPVDIDAKSRASEGLDGRLVRTRGTVVNELRRPDAVRFTLQSGGTFFEAWLDHEGPAAQGLDIPPDTEIELVGIYRTVVDDTSQSQGFRLELRSSGDLRIVRRADFWTLGKALGIAAVLGGCAVLGLAWAATLRLRVRRQMEQIKGQLQKEMALEDRHRGLVENASDFIFTTDLAGRFTSFNSAGERLTGYTRVQAMELNIRDLLVPEQDREAWRNPEQVLAGDNGVTMQSRLLTRQNKQVWVETSVRLVRDGGHAVGVLGIVRDISKRKEIEEELKRARDAAEANTRAKSEFLANMSHEIRTPMNAVIGMSNLLLDTALDERQRDFAETIRNGAEALLTVLNDILDFSKMEAGRLRLDTEDFDLRDAVDGTIELLAVRAASKQLELTAIVPPELPTALRGDADRLRQVLLNMLGNALKFTEHGEVRLNVTQDSETETHLKFLFEITDTGVGISETEQERLFRPFSQADGSATRRFGGTGLGLAISKQIVELLGGRCGVRSRPGHGSTFWFTASFEKQKNSSGAPSIITSTRLRRLTALIADDCAANCGLLDLYARSWGMRTTSAPTGAKALELLMEAAAVGHPFSVVVVDSVLPDMSGMELVRSLRKSTLLAATPVVMLNSLNSIVSPAEVKELAIGSSFFKPVRMDDFMAALLQACTVEGAGSAEGIARTFPGSMVPGPVAPARSANPLDTPTSLRVLLAEDNPVNQRVALLQLQKLGHKARAVSNGAEALAAIENEEFDAILMDCQMPEMDGFEATRRIRKHDTRSKIRIIALTANAMQGDREKCIDAGMDDYLSKPVRVAELRAALLRCVPVAR